MPAYETLSAPNGGLVKAWVHGVSFDEQARRQVLNAASLPFIHQWVAVMPDVHVGIGATIGSVIPTRGAIIPAAVGVDIGCGMMAVQTRLCAEDLPESLREIRAAIEAAVPHGFNDFGGKHQRGGWKEVPDAATKAWTLLAGDFKRLTDKYPRFKNANSIKHLGTLGGGNHFVELCLDEKGAVWVMLHSGSRGIGNQIGTYFIELAREDMREHIKNLPDRDLAYFNEGTEHFKDYVFAVEWAQRFAALNRETMMRHILAALGSCREVPPFDARIMAVNCHHNYVAREHHFGEEVFVTRKGAVRARAGEMGIIPGSMGARSFIVRGKGNAESFHSCSHGAGRLLSRTEAKRRFTVEDQVRMTEGVECRKDAGVIDEIPAAYKPIDAVMQAQSDLVEIVHTLKQVLCVKG